MTRDEISKIENGFFLPAYDKFESVLNKMNLSLEVSGIKLSLLVKDDFRLNAHAQKRGNDYSIVLLSGLIPITFEILAENVDFFMKEYADMKDKETPVALGCVFIWHHIFGHEMGHISRGHLSLVKSKETNLVGDYQVSSLGYNGEGEDFSDVQIKALMEYDADIFSAQFVADVLLNTIKKSSGVGLTERTLVSLCLTSIFFFFNTLCKLDGVDSKYPPAMVRLNALQSHLIKYLSGKANLSDDDLKDIMNESLYSAYSYLVDEGRLFQSMDDISLDKLFDSENKLIRQYSAFDKVLSEGFTTKK